MQSVAYRLIAMLILAASVASAEESEVLRKNLWGQVPPEIVGEKSQWMGKSSPVTLAALKGKVVWLQFNF